MAWTAHCSLHILKGHPFPSKHSTPNPCVIAAVETVLLLPMSSLSSVYLVVGADTAAAAAGGVDAVAVTAIVVTAAAAATAIIAVFVAAEHSFIQ